MLDGSVTDGDALVVGVGSLLRGDDAIGRLVAEEIERRAHAGVTTRTVTQLVPELVDEMSRASTVVFVDADVAADGPTIRAVEPSSHGPLTHHGTPESLCTLAHVAGMSCPPAYVVGMPAERFDVGHDPSEECLGHIDAAIDIIWDTLRGRSPFPLPGAAEPL